MSHTPPAPQHRLADLRDWLMDQIDGSIETRGDDGLISDFIRQIDALSETVATVEPRGCPTPGSCSAVAEIADLKQRLLPQFQGRAQRAERDRDAAQVAAIAAERDAAFAKHERDALLEQLIAARSATAAPLVEEKAVGHARYAYLRTLNPRKFSALYNEALMGVYQFDDLVDRYRDAGER